MDSARTQLIKGAVKSALAAISGSTLAANLLDPSKFSVMTLAGVEHSLILGACVVGAAELRYIGQWLDKWSST